MQEVKRDETYFQVTPKENFTDRDILCKANKSNTL